MILYRLERETGDGPYVNPFRDCLQAHLAYDGYHQGPYYDHIDDAKSITLYDLMQKNISPDSYYFALRNKKLFFKWFSKKEMRDLAEVSRKESIPIYYCEYEVDKKYTISSNIQTVFLKKYAKLKKKIPLGEYLDA